MPTLSLNTDICGITLRNPIILASGVLGLTAETLERLSFAGAGGLVTKSIGREPRKGHPNPSVLELPAGLLNAMGLPNPGIEEFGKELSRLKTLEAPIIGSVFGENANEYAELAAKMEGFGVSGIELNLSCPHAKGLGMELGSDPKMVKEIVKAVDKAVNVPVFAKLTPHTPNIVELGSAAAKAGASGLVAINTIKAMKIDTATGLPVLGNKIGGYSGPAIKPIGVRAVYELSSKIDIPIIGVGGISTGEDVAEYLMAGASAVQIGTVLLEHGIDAFDVIHRQLRQFMEEYDYTDVKDLIGLAVEK